MQSGPVATGQVANDDRTQRIRTTNPEVDHPFGGMRGLGLVRRVGIGT